MVAGQRQDLEAAVQQQGMQFHPRRVDRIVEGERGQGLSFPCPGGLDRVVGGAEVDAGRGPHRIELHGVLGRQLGLERLRVERGKRFDVRPSRGESTAGVKGPALLALSFREDLEGAFREVVRAVQNELQGAASAIRSVFRILLVEHQRAVDLQLVHDRRPGALAQRHRDRHAAVEPAGDDHLLVDQVIQKPRGIGGEHLRLEHDFAAGRLVADAEQRMSVGLVAALRRPDPVLDALERIAGQGDPAPGLAGEQALELDVEAGPPGAGDGLGEAAAGVGGRLFGVAGRTPQTGEHRRGTRLRRRGPDHRDDGPEHGVGADLHDRVHSHLRQRLDAGPKRHRLARVATPVRGVHPGVRVEQPARDVADQGDGGGRRRGRDLPDGRFQLVQGGFDQGAVVRGAPAQPVRLDALGFEAGEHRVEFGGRSAHHLLGSIVDGDGEVGVGRAGVVLGHRLGDA